MGCNVKTTHNEKGKNEIVAFQPDTTINNKLILRNSESVKDFFYGEFDLIPESKANSFPVVYFSNRSGTEYVAAYQYYGDIKNQFSLFEVGYCNSLSGIEFIQTDHDSFMTESEIKLGMTKEEIIKIKGHEFMEDKGTLGYVLSDSNSVFPKKYKLSAYLMNYHFENDKLVKFSFGFEYP